MNLFLVIEESRRLYCYMHSIITQNIQKQCLLTTNSSCFRATTITIHSRSNIIGTDNSAPLERLFVKTDKKNTFYRKLSVRKRARNQDTKIIYGFGANLREAERMRCVKHNYSRLMLIWTTFKNIFNYRHYNIERSKHSHLSFNVLLIIAGCNALCFYSTDNCYSFVRLCENCSNCIYIYSDL